MPTPYANALLDSLASADYEIVPIDVKLAEIAARNAALDAQVSNAFGKILRNVDGSYR